MKGMMGFAALLLAALAGGSGYAPSRLAPPRGPRYSRGAGNTVAADKRRARKARNRKRHKAHV